jgi:hypothetical protein
LADTTFRPALLVPPLAARLKIPTWSPGLLDVDLALIATPEETLTETGAVMVCLQFDSTAEGGANDRFSNRRKRGFRIYQEAFRSLALPTRLHSVFGKGRTWLDLNID